ncbi:MAG TPA: hypothetical protein VF188_12215 [Longimicrobiales bacterium]
MYFVPGQRVGCEIMGAVAAGFLTTGFARLLNSTTTIMTRTRLPLAFLVVLASIQGCVEVSWSEVARVRSPDGVVDAVLIRSDAGATTSYVYRVFLAPQGEEVPPGDVDQRLFTGDQVEGLDLHWRSPHFLEIRYRQARIDHFANFGQVKVGQNGRYVAEIRLIALAESWSLPPRERPP